MIQKLRFRLIGLAVLFQLFLLIVIVLFSNYVSYLKLADTADTVIDELWKEPWAAYDPETSDSTASAADSTAASTAEASADSAAESSALEGSAASDAESSYESSDVPPPTDSGPNMDPDSWSYWAQGTQNWTDADFKAWQKWWKQADKNGPPQGDPQGKQPWDSEPYESPSPSATPSPSPTASPSPQAEEQTVQRPSEVPFESRYYIVTESEAGDLLSLNMDHIISVSPVEALSTVQEIKQEGKQRGFSGNLRYGVRDDGTTVSYLFLDCRRDLETFRNSLIANCLISALGLLIVFGLMVVFSRRIVKPVAESYEKQKQFVSAAGHELRTPLSIISADAELLQMDIGENEWLQDIHSQTKRMSELTESLLTLSRMDEGTAPMQWIEFPVSDLVEETVHSFIVLAQAKGQTVKADVEPMLSMVGDAKAIRQLVSIFMDNAVKYSTGTIAVSLKKEEDWLLLSVENSSEPLNQEQLSRFFDRFYRTEASRNSETGGYGLGLAIAKAIVEAHKGEITATSPAPGMVRLTATLPVFGKGKH